MFPKGIKLYRPLDEFEPKCVVELKMLKMSQEIRQKPGWHEKVSNPDIVAKWKTEAGEQGLTPEAVDFVIDELKHYVTLRDGCIEPGPVDGTWRADKLIDQETSSKLKKLVAEGLESGEKDYHPGSDELVVDLVHPSLYCFVADRSILINEGTVDKTMIPNQAGSKEKKPKSYFQTVDPPSGNYRWLPAEVSCTDDFTISFDSYINNLHPIKHKELYETIGKILSKFIPMFNRSLTDVVNWKDTRLDSGNWSWYGDEEFDYDKYADDDDYEDDFKEWENGREILPVPIPKFKAQKPKKEINLKGKKLQVVVKLANIELTPEKPEYGGGTWHVEGIEQERIVATGIHYYDMENITESKLLFRQSISDPNYDQNDERGVREIFGMKDNDPLNQVVGNLVAQQDRCIVFPNIYQHFVAPFELVDKQKQGFRKILVFFLVDPTVKVISTHNVLPQQEDWADVKSEAPADQRKTMTKQEAVEMREKLMFERKYARDEYQKEFYEREFSLCEH